jgi:hypothetical protein
MQPGESWVSGITAGAFLVALAAGDFANVMNRIIGVPYTAAYAVAEKYTNNDKRTCYGLALTKVWDPLDQFRMCVSEAEQGATEIGDVIQVTGRRSQYVNQMLSYTKSR